MREYDVTVSRVGNIRIMADSPDEAMKIANEAETKDITWAGDFMATDAQPVED